MCNAGVEGKPLQLITEVYTALAIMKVLVTGKNSKASYFPGIEHCHTTAIIQLHSL